jgi:hypothetical protein
MTVKKKSKAITSINLLRPGDSLLEDKSAGHSGSDIFHQPTAAGYLRELILRKPTPLEAESAR